MLPNVVKWLFFSVVVALSPIYSSLIVCFISGAGEPLHKAFQNGELLIISVGICSVAMGELMAAGRLDGLIKLLSICIAGTAILIVITSCLIFLRIEVQATFDEWRLFVVSSWLFIFSFFVGLASVCICALSEERDSVF